MSLEDILIFQMQESAVLSSQAKIFSRSARLKEALGSLYGLVITVASMRVRETRSIGYLKFVINSAVLGTLPNQPSAQGKGCGV